MLVQMFLSKNLSYSIIVYNLHHFILVVNIVNARNYQTCSRRKVLHEIYHCVDETIQKNKTRYQHFSILIPRLSIVWGSYCL